MFEADRLPAPPEKLPGELDLVEEKLSLWRLHWEGDPLKIESHPTGKFRFDAPAGEYRALYGSADRLATFAEVYGDVRVIEESQKGRKLSRISSTDALRLIPLDAPGTQKLLGLDGRIGMSKQYPATQRWASRLFQWLPEAQGIRYLSRHAGENRNYCLFLERCAGELEVEDHGSIASLREVVMLAADRYRLEVHWDA